MTATPRLAQPRPYPARPGLDRRAGIVSVASRVVPFQIAHWLGEVFEIFPVE
jgi:hypothetical protein